MMEIRKITSKDAAGLAEICIETGLHSWSEKSFIQETENPIAYYAVLDAGSELAGFAGIWCVVDEAQVMNVGVCPQYQRQGYGEKLMNHLCDVAKAEGCHEMTLEVKAGNVPALNLYKKMGFVQTGLRKDYYPDHSDGILMRKVLV